MTELQREEVYKWLESFLYRLGDFSKNNNNYLYDMYDDEAYFISYIIVSKALDVVKPDSVARYKNTLLEISIMITNICTTDKQFKDLLHFNYIVRRINDISCKTHIKSYENAFHITLVDNHISYEYNATRENLFSDLFNVCGDILDDSGKEQSCEYISDFIHDIGECFYAFAFDLMHDADYEYFSVKYGETLTISFNNKFPEETLPFSFDLSNANNSNQHYINEHIGKITVDKEEDLWYNNHVHQAISNTIEGEDKMKNIQLTLGGKLAVKRSNGDYVFMNKEGKMENVGKSIIDTMVVPMEVAKSELAVGDIIDRGELMFVKKINDDSVDVVNLENRVEQLIEEVSVSGAIPMFTKMVSPLDSKSIENETVRMSLLSKGGDSVALMQMLANKEQSDKMDKLTQSLDTLAQAMTVIMQGLAKKD